ncbi:hypothetical protein GBC03_02525 [Citrobacter telavivensis]|uniref:Uncharacterized protein n=1 Tax=Citrobacter telavivensis TaxID=2653932 RepID=A0A6L5EA41_9ENTR|nr:hypothetical protein [Citrobacter telavivensis]QFS69160.1 hypothetical protein GBC03_02525 [Citrobacter telavivensis]
MLIFASISFLLLLTLTIQQPHLLMQIKFTFIYSLRGILLICLHFLKLWKYQTFRDCMNNIQIEGFLAWEDYH